VTECRPKSRRLVQDYVEHYNNARVNSAIGQIAPKGMQIHAQRDRKLEEARKQRQVRCQKAA
jgi:hypothetical protein